MARRHLERRGIGLVSPIKQRFVTLVPRLFLFIVVCVCLYPLIWMVLNGFRTETEIFLQPLGIPSHLNFDNFVSAWDTISSSILDTAVATATTVVAVTIFSSMAAYPLSRMRFRGMWVIFLTFMACQMVSRENVLITLFSLFNRLGMLNSIASVICADTAFGVPFALLLFWQFFREIPDELEEATRVDGCTRWMFYWKFVLPLSRSVISTVVIFQALGTWNDYLFPLAFLHNPSVQMISTSLQAFFSEFTTNYGALFAALSITTIPIILLYLGLQKAFIRGLTGGMLKG